MNCESQALRFSKNQPLTGFCSRAGWMTIVRVAKPYQSLIPRRKVLLVGRQFDRRGVLNEIRYLTLEID